MVQMMMSLRSVMAITTMGVAVSVTSACTVPDGTVSTDDTSAGEVSGSSTTMVLGTSNTGNDPQPGSESGASGTTTSAVDESGEATEATGEIDSRCPPECIPASSEHVEGFPREPGYATPWYDPIYHVTITRVTDNDAEGPIPGTSNVHWEDRDIYRPSYGTHQAWNADGTILYLATGSLFLDATDPAFSSLGLTRPAGTWKWSRTDPHHAIGLAGDAVIVMDVTTGDTVETFPLAGYDDLTIMTRNALSYDGTRMGVKATRLADDEIVALAVDLRSGSVLHEVMFSHYDLGPGGGFSEDKERFQTISPSGDYLVINGYNTVEDNNNDQAHWFEIGSSAGVNGDGYVGEQVPNCGVECPGGHGDLGLDSAGNDVFFGVCKGGGCAPFGDDITGTTIGLRLDDGVLQTLVEPRMSHASGQCSALPGVGYGSTNGEQARIMRFSLDGLGTVEHLVNTYSQGNGGYYAETQVIVSPDGQRIAYSSDWTGLPETYVADLSELCPPGCSR